MNSIKLLELAELALAGYGQFRRKGTPRTGELENLNGDTHGFSTLQASRFAARLEVAVPTFEDATSPGGSGRTSFDTTVFRRLDGADKGKIFISFRGTGQQFDAPLPNDISAADEILGFRAAASQIVAMYNWWQRVSTVDRTDLPQYRIVHRLCGQPAPAGGLFLPDHVLPGPIELLGRDYLVRITAIARVRLRRCTTCWRFSFGRRSGQASLRRASARRRGIALVLTRSKL